ncbi:MAG: hypothetical protein ACRDY0_03365 [Acidimicrobiales bacterium]
MAGRWRRPFASSEAVQHKMTAVARRDTGPELALRRVLHRRGLRYRVHRCPLPDLARQADIVFSGAKVAVFVDGRSWHGCPEHGRREHRTNGWYWPQKLAVNQVRDGDTDDRLHEAGGSRSGSASTRTQRSLLGGLSSPSVATQSAPRMSDEFCRGRLPEPGARAIVRPPRVAGPNSGPTFLQQHSMAASVTSDRTAALRQETVRRQAPTARPTPSPAVAARGAPRTRHSRRVQQSQWKLAPIRTCGSSPTRLRTRPRYTSRSSTG